MKWILVSTILLLSACDNPNDWACINDKNKYGDWVQYSKNLRTGEIASAEKACD